MRSLLLVTLLVGLMGLGCSGETGLQCGPGTHEDNGYIVLSQSPIGCAN